MHTPPAVEVDDLARTFGDVRAVDGVSFAVARGQVLGLLGPNGSGKTTTMRVLSTLLPPTAGRARVLGHDVVADAARVRARIGLTGQYAAVDESDPPGGVGGGEVTGGQDRPGVGDEAVEVHRAARAGVRQPGGDDASEHVGELGVDHPHVAGQRLARLGPPDGHQPARRVPRHRQLHDDSPVAPTCPRAARTAPPSSRSSTAAGSALAPGRLTRATAGTVSGHVRQ